MTGSWNPYVAHGMDDSNGESVLSLPEADRRFAMDGTRDGLEVAGSFARELLAIRDVESMEVGVLDAIRRTTGAHWTALFRPTPDGGFGFVRSLPEARPASPPEVGLELTRALATANGRISRCDDRPVPRIDGADLLVPLRSEAEPPCAVVLCGSSPSRRYGEDEMSAVRPLAAVCATALQNSEQVERLRAEVFVDAITGCYNRRAFDEHLKVELVRAQRYGRPLCLLLLDLDDFKPVNDALGHPAGDYVLQRIGETLRSNFRTTDRVCRYGGDEFAVIFPETHKADVVRLAERLRRQIARLFPDTIIPRSISASIGIASFPNDATTPADLLRFADSAMYGAKSSGRNQIGLR